MLTPEARGTSEVEPIQRRKSPQRSLERRATIKELTIAGNSPIQTAKIMGITKQGVFFHVKEMLATGELTPSQCNYTKAGPVEERHRYKIIERVLEELSFYQQQGLVPTARKMGYRLIELAVAAKKAGHDVIKLGLPDLPNITAGNYSKEKHLFFDRFYGDTAEARRGVDSTYTKETYLPKLPINCFRDDVRITIGSTDIDYGPTDPTPKEPPEDPEEYIDIKKENVNNAIQYLKNSLERLKDAPSLYDGECEAGQEGRNPGFWFNQPVYCEIWCESDTIQPDLIKYQDKIKVKVAALRGYASTPSIYDNCVRLKQIVEALDCIEKIIILYFGDSDEAGNKIANNIEAALKFYSGGGMLDNGNEILASTDLEIPIEIEFRRIAVTPQQVKDYRLTGYQLEAFMTTEKRLKIFKQIVQDAIKDCWDEDIYDENCPDEEYDYEAAGEEVPEDIDPDNTYFDDDTEETYTEMMERKVNEALENDFKKYVNEKDDGKEEE